MKKIYPQSRENKRWYESWAVALAFLVIAITFSPARAYVSWALAYTVQPFWNAGQFAVHTAVWVRAELGSKYSLEKKNRAQGRLIAHLTERLNYVTTLQNENTDLKKLLSRSNRLIFSSTTEERLCPPSPTAIGARTMLLPANSYYTSLLVDVGSNDNVRRGDPVYSFGDVALGTVTDVYPALSRVVLYSAPKLSTNALLGKDHIPVVLVGDGDGTFTTTLPKNVSITVGDQALLPLGGRTLVATVQAVLAKTDAPFETVYLKGPTNLHSLTWVYVDRTSSQKSEIKCMDDTF